MRLCRSSRSSALQRRRHLLSACVLVLSITSKTWGHVYTDSFPTIDEYEEMILDPDHIHGSPFGGYSRATATRLAALPMRLPDIDIELSDFEPMYYETRDNLGRRFVCRTYHEDEVDPSSLEDSMFDTVKLREISANTNDDKEGEPSNGADKMPGSKISSNDVKTTTQLTGKEGSAGLGTHGSTSGSIGNDNDPAVESNADGAAGIGQPSSTSEGVLDNDTAKFIAEINRRLARLGGVCAQLHQGWWSYEWCHQKKVSQFHVHVEADASKVSDIQLQDETKLGGWSQRKIKLLLDGHATKDDGVDDDTASEPEDSASDNGDGSGIDEEKIQTQSTRKPNLFSETTPELAMVSDYYTDGDICPETGKARYTQVDIRCCSTRVMNRIKGGVLLNGRPIKSDTVAIHSLGEQKDAVCVYNVTVCTTLLCGSVGSDGAIVGGAEDGVGKSTTTTTSTDKSGIEKEEAVLGKVVNVDNMSVREILDLTFGKSHTTCIQGNIGAWWVYELCPGRHVRQFHETTLMDRISGVASTAVETEYILGNYKKEDHETHPNEDEWKYVVNGTDPGGLGLLTRRSSNKGGGGTYYYQEYTSGDVCDDEDVTDSTIKAGAVGEGHVFRSCTVRYSCGNRLEMNVKEDHTCHYIVDVTIPSLCGHPLFKPPVKKKHIVKCLPAEDSLGHGDDWLLDDELYI